MNQVAIKFSNVTKDFYFQEDRTFKELVPSLLTGGSWAKKLRVFSQVDFEIYKGESVAIIGGNGAGKSTILKLIAQVTYPTRGKVEVSGRVAPLIELGAGFHHELTGHENIFLNAAILGMHKKEIEERYDEIVDFSGMEEYLNMPVKRYSTGMYMRLAFAIAIHTDADIILVDEVLAVGDVEFQEKCLTRLRKLKESGEKTLIFVSHDERAVKSFCDRGLYLADHKLELDGSLNDIYKSYDVR